MYSALPTPTLLLTTHSNTPLSFKRRGRPKTSFPPTADAPSGRAPPLLWIIKGKFVTINWRNQWCYAEVINTQTHESLPETTAVSHVGEWDRTGANHQSGSNYFCCSVRGGNTQTCIDIWSNSTGFIWYCCVTVVPTTSLLMLCQEHYKTLLDAHWHDCWSIMI